MTSIRQVTSAKNHVLDREKWNRVVMLKFIYDEDILEYIRISCVTFWGPVRENFAEENWRYQF